jgi:hypothetical protein
LAVSGDKYQVRGLLVEPAQVPFGAGELGRASASAALNSTALGEGQPSRVRQRE